MNRYVYCIFFLIYSVSSIAQLNIDEVKSEMASISRLTELKNMVQSNKLTFEFLNEVEWGVGLGVTNSKWVLGLYDPDEENPRLCNMICLSKEDSIVYWELFLDDLTDHEVPKFKEPIIFDDRSEHFKELQVLRQISGLNFNVLDRSIESGGVFGFLCDYSPAYGSFLIKSGHWNRIADLSKGLQSIDPVVQIYSYLALLVTKEINNKVLPEDTVKLMKRVKRSKSLIKTCGYSSRETVPIYEILYDEMQIKAFLKRE